MPKQCDHRGSGSQRLPIAAPQQGEEVSAKEVEQLVRESRIASVSDVKAVKAVEGKDKDAWKQPKYDGDEESEDGGLWTQCHQCHQCLQWDPRRVRRCLRRVRRCAVICQQAAAG